MHMHMHKEIFTYTQVMINGQVVSLGSAHTAFPRKPAHRIVGVRHALSPSPA